MLKAAVVYSAVVFGAGFVLGTFRVLWPAPQIGTRAAELAESPLMLLVTFLAARRVNTHCCPGVRPRDHLVMGPTALAFLLAAEIGLGLALRGGSVRAILLDKDPVSGTAYYALLGVYALMPWLLGHRARPSHTPEHRMPIGNWSAASSSPSPSSGTSSSGPPRHGRGDASGCS